MAGSRADFIYQDDAGMRLALNLDESNSRGNIRPTGTTTNTPLFLPTAAPFPGRPPTSFRARGVNTFNSADPTETRFFKVGNPAAYTVALAGPSEILAFRSAADEPGSDVNSSIITWVVRSARPERRGTQPNFTMDTGLNDGTPTVTT
jgi:hypothetical protein